MTSIYAAAFFCSTLILLNLVSVGIAMVRTRPKMRAAPTPAPAPGVSIVRPVCGLDNFCEETLGSSFSLDYPLYEIIFCVARGSDPVAPLVRRLIAAHPKIPARLIVGDEKVSANPKLNNCVRGWDAAQHDYIVLADANVMMPKDYIQRLLAGFGPTTGLVCSMPLGSRPQNLWAELECAFLNTFEARWQYAAAGVAGGFAQGKNMMWRRQVLEAGGGIRALAAEIAEDAASTKLVRAQGLTVDLVDRPFEQPLGRRSLRDVWMRQLRWARMRRKTFPLHYAPEIFAGAALPCLVAAYGAHALDASAFGVLGAAVLTALVWHIPEMILARTAGWHFSWRMPLMFVLRDLMLPIMYVDAWFVDNFTWRGNEMSVREEPSAHGG
ncbi:Ceramide glucosyltransferase [Methylocella silvestris BL2]|uniref:Ceramide glucosyltransferase n=1 Tax=Methylocella silvestris (strain DSM 15510 / CIP 108128 / LMG 27833 / NCIMB 13906 / BL2) TaxID=395965 RepID=B8EMX7_METSB|nr:ceramide glucosyltransferase [Methylocella silvestris]ACK49112.1 Ceramide glucosyltransferase [Methylocella silvestris BL2]